VQVKVLTSHFGEKNMQAFVSLLWIAVSLSSYSLSSIPEGEWVSPEVDIQLVESIDVSQYGEPVTDMLGRVSFVETADGEKWRLVLVNTDNITILEEGAQARQIPYSFESDHYRMSPDNKYILLTSNNSVGYNAARINSETGEIVQFNCCPEGKSPASPFVSNSGSVFSWFNGGFAFYDASLQNRNTLFAYENGSYTIDRVNDGSITFIACDSAIKAYDVNGDLMWENNLTSTNMDDDLQIRWITVSPLGDKFIALTSHGWTFVDSFSGDILWAEYSARAASLVMFDRSGETVYRSSFAHTPPTARISHTTVCSNSVNLSEIECSFLNIRETRTIAPCSCSDNGLLMYHIGQYPGERILVLAKSDGTTIWSERVTRTPDMISGTAYTLPHLSFGELSRDGSSMCIYTDGSFNVYEIAARQ
jgi:hypothetical protein